MFCQQRKNVNIASRNKGICRNPITRLWEENSLAAGQKRKGGNGSCASNNSGVFSQMERDPSTAGPSGRAQRKVFPAPELGVQTSLPGSVVLVTYSSSLSHQGY